MSGDSTLTVFQIDETMISDSKSWKKIGQFTKKHLKSGAFEVAGPKTWQAEFTPGVKKIWLMCKLDYADVSSIDLTKIKSLNDLMKLTSEHKTIALKKFLAIRSMHLMLTLRRLIKWLLKKASPKG